MASSPVHLLLLTGPPGVGKSVVATAVSDRLSRAGVVHAVVDLDELDRRHQPGSADLHFANLECAWRNFAGAGITRLVVAWTLDSRRDLERLADAVPRAAITVCRLRASAATLLERIGRRETPYLRPQLERLAKEHGPRMDEEGGEDLLVETEGRSVEEIAEQVVAEWLLPAG